MENQKIQERIEKIRAYFEKKCVKDSHERCIFEITQFEVEDRERKYDTFTLPNIHSIKITTNVKNPNNPFLQNSYYIILSKTGKVSRLLAHDHPSKKYASLVKSNINRGL